MQITLDIDDELSDAISITCIGINAAGIANFNITGQTLKNHENETLVIRKDKKAKWQTYDSKDE